MAEVSFVLKLLRRAKVCQRGQKWLTRRNKTPTASWNDVLRYFTCCSLLEPFCFCFRRPSYCFRPSRYSATASLDGFFSRGESLYVIQVCESGQDGWRWEGIEVMKLLCVTCRHEERGEQIAFNLLLTFCKLFREFWFSPSLVRKLKKPDLTLKLIADRQEKASPIGNREHISSENTLIYSWNTYIAQLYCIIFWFTTFPNYKFNNKRN